MVDFKEFYNKSSKDFLKINNIEMYSIFNEGKSVVAERFIRTLKNKIFKHMATIPKNVYFDALDDIVNPNLGGPFRGSFWGGDGVKLVPLLKAIVWELC